MVTVTQLLCVRVHETQSAAEAQDTSCCKLLLIMGAKHAITL